MMIDYKLNSSNINMKTDQGRTLTKIQINDAFTKIYEQEDNDSCFQCGKKSRQWAETKHCIFLCLTCAASYKEIPRVVNVKSIGLDVWTEQEIQVMKFGGNRKFKEFLRRYEFEVSDPKIILRTNAAEYYRRFIISQSQGMQAPQQPSLEEAKKPFPQEIPFTKMTSGEMMHEAKQRLSWAGKQTKYYGGKAYNKVHHKVTSGQLKQDAKKVGGKVSDTAKSVWGFVSSKVNEMKKDKREEPRQI